MANLKIKNEDNTWINISNSDTTVVDSILSDISENAIQNKAVTAALNGKAPAENARKLVFEIDPSGVASLSFSGQCSALIAVQGSIAKSCSLIAYNGYGVGGSRSHAKRIQGGSSILFGVHPESADSTHGITLKNASDTNNPACVVFMLYGNLPTITYEDTVTTIAPYEDDLSTLTYTSVTF
jgi:hypothetical protein